VTVRGLPFRPWDSPAAPPPAEARAEDLRSPEHEEWLLDEALIETFPASDPISPACPGDSPDATKQAA
jgi:hypothetical protein